MSKIMKNIWSLPRYKREWHNICALLPAYLPDGCNGSMILYEDGSEEEVNYRLSWVIDDLLAYKRSSKAILQEQSDRLLEELEKAKRQRLPLLLTQDVCFVPVKARRPRSRTHCADGYVVLSKVKAFSEQKGKNGCKIKFINQLEIEVLDSVRTLRGNIALAAEMTAYLREEHTSA